MVHNSNIWIIRLLSGVSKVLCNFQMSAVVVVAVDTCLRCITRELLSTGSTMFPKISYSMNKEMTLRWVPRWWRQAKYSGLYLDIACHMWIWSGSMPATLSDNRPLWAVSSPPCSPQMIVKWYKLMLRQIKPQKLLQNKRNSTGWINSVGIVFIDHYDDWLGCLKQGHHRMFHSLKTLCTTVQVAALLGQWSDSCLISQLFLVRFQTASREPLLQVLSCVLHQ